MSVMQPNVVPITVQSNSDWCHLIIDPTDSAVWSLNHGIEARYDDHPNEGPHFQITSDQKTLITDQTTLQMHPITCTLAVSTPNASFGFTSEKGGLGQVTITSGTLANPIDQRVNNHTMTDPSATDHFVLSVVLP